MTGPRCPNHLVGLVDCDYKTGQGICPISGCLFGFDADFAEKNKKHRINAMGQIEETADWKVKQVEGEDG